MARTKRRLSGGKMWVAIIIHRDLFMYSIICFTESIFSMFLIDEVTCSRYIKEGNGSLYMEKMKVVSIPFEWFVFTIHSRKLGIYVQLVNFVWRFYFHRPKTSWNSMISYRIQFIMYKWTHYRHSVENEFVPTKCKFYTIQQSAALEWCVLVFSFCLFFLFHFD